MLPLIRLHGACKDIIRLADNAGKQADKSFPNDFEKQFGNLCNIINAVSAVGKSTSHHLDIAYDQTVREIIELAKKLKEDADDESTWNSLITMVKERSVQKVDEMIAKKLLLPLILKTYYLVDASVDRLENKVDSMGTQIMGALSMIQDTIDADKHLREQANAELKSFETRLLAARANIAEAFWGTKDADCKDLISSMRSYGNAPLTDTELVNKLRSNFRPHISEGPQSPMAILQSLEDYVKKAQEERDNQSPGTLMQNYRKNVKNLDAERLSANYGPCKHHDNKGLPDCDCTLYKNSSTDPGGVCKTCEHEAICHLQCFHAR
eukprot:gene26871-32474_t